MFNQISHHIFQSLIKLKFLPSKLYKYYYRRTVLRGCFCKNYDGWDMIFPKSRFTPFNVTGCSLELLRVGEKGLVAFCHIENQAVLKKLRSLGFTIGTTFSVEQEFPSLIIKVGSILLEIDKELARAIYVRIV